MNNFKSSFQSMYRNLGMTITSIVLVSLTIIVVGFVLVLSMNINYITSNMVDEISIFTFADSQASDEELFILEQEIRNIDGVDTVELSTKDEELELFATSMGDDGDSIVELFSSSNPLNNVLKVSLDFENTMFEEVSEEIRVMDSVDTVSYGGEEGTNSFLQFTEVIKNVSFIVAGILILISLFMITNTIKLTINTRKSEIEIMRLVGATKMYIRKPFMIEGIFIGLLSSVIAIVIIYFTYNYTLNLPIFHSMQDAMLTSNYIVVTLIQILPVIGSSIGLIGSVFAMKKHLMR